VDVAGRAARYRTALAGRRLLVVLDNVHSADQVRPLLPGTPSCVVVVTSRGDLAGLVARDGARRLALNALAPNEAVALLHTLIGERVAAEPAAAALLAERCTRLPLPLRIAAELAAARPDTSLAQLADDLREQSRRLDLLDTGDDPHTAVRAVLSWSHRHLPPAAAAAFGLLGLHPGETFDTYAVAALTGTGLDEAGERLRELTRAHLVQTHGAQRLGMHDLLRAYSAERAATDLEAGRARAAVTRLLDFYLYTATVAVDVAFPAERANLPRLAGPDTPVPVIDAPEAALEWLNHERPNLVASGTHAVRHGRPEQSIHLSQVLWRYLDEYPEDALAVHSAAVAAAPPDHPGRARALTNLGVAYWRNGRPEDALDRLHEAVKGHKDSGDRRGEARALGNIGLVYESLGRFAEALDHDRQVREIYRETGDRRHEIGLLINLGALCVRSGRPAEAAEHQREAVAMARALDDRRLEGHILIGLGAACEGLGEYEQARQHLELALTISREYNHRRNEGFALGGLGQVHLGLGRFATAVEHHEMARAIGHEVGDRLLETEALNSLGDTLRAMGNPAAARQRHHEALDLAHQTGDRPEEARALEGIAHALHDTGEGERAERFWREALDIYTGMHLPQADRLRARLAVLSAT
jgi:tetratricopeptide (TPR) repeat protein